MVAVGWLKERLLREMVTLSLADSDGFFLGQRKRRLRLSSGRKERGGHPSLQVLGARLELLPPRVVCLQLHRRPLRARTPRLLAHGGLRTTAFY